jgi:hypothetical protein
VMAARREQDNFQLIVITHDEHFAHLIGEHWLVRANSGAGRVFRSCAGQEGGVGVSVWEAWQDNFLLVVFTHNEPIAHLIRTHLLAHTLAQGGDGLWSGDVAGQGG